MPENDYDERQVTFEEMEHRAVQARRDTQHFFVQVVQVALDVLSKRLLVFLSLVLTASLFLWSMVDASALRLIASSLFAVLVFLPVLWTVRKDLADGQ